MAYNQNVESFRDHEYPMLKGKTYLDHGGATIYSRSLIESFSQHMMSDLYGNPHSASIPAEFSGQMVDDVRVKTLRFLGVDPEEFDLVFVANATAAIKLVMDCFRDVSANDSSTGGFDYLYHVDSHTSVVGIREVARTYHSFANDAEVETWLNGTNPDVDTSTDVVDRLCLFSYPGQSNMTGRRLPLSWTGKLRTSELPAHINSYTLFDAAALAMTSSLEDAYADPDLAPDFASVSFYKIFGFPDLGGLIVRRDSDHILSWRKYFGGGTIEMVTVGTKGLHWIREGDIHNRLEDGTLGFHNILALGCAIDVHHRLYTDMRSVSKHVSYLGRRLYLGLTSLRHSNGEALCEIYNETGNRYTDAKIQGGTIAFNLKQPTGIYHRYADIEAAANERHVYLRAGGLCNPGGIENYLSLRLWQMRRAWGIGARCKVPVENKIINRQPVGVVRASLGAMSTVADVDNLLNWLAHAYLDVIQPDKLNAKGAAIREGNLFEQDVANVQTMQPHSVRKLSQDQVSLSSSKQSAYATETPLEVPTSLNVHLDLRTGPRTKIHSRATTITDIEPEFIDEMQKLWAVPPKDKTGWNAGHNATLDKSWAMGGLGNEMAHQDNRWVGKALSDVDMRSMKWPLEEKDRTSVKGLWKGRKKSFMRTKTAEA